MSLNSYNLERLHILIVDDDAHMRHLVRSILNTLGVKKTSEASNGADALKEMHHFPADIVICDWSMDPLNGIDFTKMIRTASDSPNPFVPIIMLTAHTEVNRVMQARDAGISEFLAKPISAKALYSRICMVIDNPRVYIRSNGNAGYIGPTRRRKSRGGIAGVERRTVPSEDLLDS